MNMIRGPPANMHNNNIKNHERMDLSFIVYLLAILIISAISNCHKDV
jgi:hypothetical protein